MGHGYRFNYGIAGLSERGVRIDHNKEQSSVAIFHERQEMLGAQS
jgi:hypothetical protein